MVNPYIAKAPSMLLQTYSNAPFCQKKCNSKINHMPTFIQIFPLKSVWQFLCPSLYSSDLSFDWSVYTAWLLIDLVHATACSQTERWSNSVTCLACCVQSGFERDYL